MEDVAARCTIQVGTAHYRDLNTAIRRKIEEGVRHFSLGGVTGQRYIGSGLEHGVVIEINANPHRLDLDWREIRAAKAAGVRFAINPDAHHTSGYDHIRHGVGTARKGWLTRKDVVNTLTAEKLLASFRARG